jgi:hypothetical protein
MDEVWPGGEDVSPEAALCVHIVRERLFCRLRASGWYAQGTVLQTRADALNRGAVPTGHPCATYHGDDVEMLEDEGALRLHVYGPGADATAVRAVARRVGLQARVGPSTPEGSDRSCVYVTVSSVRRASVFV